MKINRGSGFFDHKTLLLGCLPVLGYMILICGILLSAEPLSAGTTEVLLQNLKSAEAFKMQYADRAALELYEEVLRLQPNHPGALGNAVYLHVRLGWLDKDKSSRLQHYQQAYDQAARLFRLYPESYEAHIALGAAKAKLAAFLGNGEKVKIARELEEHAKFVLNQRSDNPDVWFLFGWWHFTIARVSKTERFLAALLFGGLPTGASTDQAIACLQKAIHLRPDYCVYHYDLGLFYERMGNSRKASESYRMAAGIPPRAPEDFLYIEKARKSLAKMQP
jgi:regulator of microtubule dynamics protein 3